MFCEHVPYPGAGYHCLRDAGHYRPAGHPEGADPHSDLTLLWDDAGNLVDLSGAVI